MKNKKLYIILSVAVLSVVMNLVDGVLTPPYAVKSAVKLVLFAGVPLIYYLTDRKERAVLKKLLTPSKKGFALSLPLGAGCFAVILGAFFALRGIVDFSGITKSLTGDSGITSENFIFVALYISFVNSFLEEFFFRGFAFVTLKRHASRRLAYFLGAFLFAFYHVGMTVTWLPFPVFLAELAGLTGGGLIFNFLCEKTETVYPSYIVHMCCNFGINLIGFILFGVI